MKADTKVCPDCGEDKPLTEFSPDKRGGKGRATYCRPCFNARRTAWRKAHPEKASEENRRRRAYKREHERNQVKACQRCGGPMGAASRYSDDRYCRPCWDASEAERVAARDRVLEALWAEGLTVKEAAKRLGWTIGHLSEQMDRARKRGANLPYRYQLRKPRHPDQVAA